MARTYWLAAFGLSLAVTVLDSPPTRAQDAEDSPVESSFIDPDTPHLARVTLDKYGRMFDLVMSDEFNQDGRDFSAGADLKWTATHNHDKTNRAC